MTSSLGFKARVGSALFAFCGGEGIVHSPRSTSGATLADLLASNLRFSFPLSFWGNLRRRREVGKTELDLDVWNLLSKMEHYRLLPNLVITLGEV